MAEENEAIENQNKKTTDSDKKADEGSPIIMYAVLGILGILAIYGGFIMSKYILITNYEEVQAQKLEEEFRKYGEIDKRSAQKRLKSLSE